MDFKILVHVKRKGSEDTRLLTQIRGTELLACFKILLHLRRSIYSEAVYTIFTNRFQNHCYIYNRVVY